MTTIEIATMVETGRIVATVDGEPADIDRIETRLALNEPTRVWVNGYRSEGPLRLVMDGVVIAADPGSAEFPGEEHKPYVRDETDIPGTSAVPAE